MTHYADDWERIQNNAQLELHTVIDHKPRPIRANELGITYEAFCASSGRQLAKMARSRPAIGCASRLFTICDW